jgi:hypothetical protein
MAIALVLKMKMIGV